MKPVLVLSLVAMMAMTSAANAQQGQGCVPQTLASLDMQTIPDGRVTIPVQLDGHDHRLLVDTGGFFNTLTPQLVREAGYHPRPSRRMALKGMGARAPLNTFVRVRDFTLGRTHDDNRIFFVDDFNDLSVDGTLVPSALAGYDVDFDFGHDRLNLIRSNGCSAAAAWTKGPVTIVPMQIPDHTHIRLPVTIDGRNIWATLDTGTTTSFISAHAASMFLGIDEKNARMALLGDIPVNGTVGPVYRYPFESLTLGDVTVSHPDIQIVSDQVWGEDDLLLGIDLLRRFHLYIAYGEKKLYLTPALAN